MQNVKMQVKGSELVITIDLAARLGPSKSGKTEIVATTAGNATIPGTNGAKLGLNVYLPR